MRIKTRGHLLNSGRPRKPTTQSLVPTLQHDVAQIVLSLPQLAHHLHGLLDYNRRIRHRTPFDLLAKQKNGKTKQNQNFRVACTSTALEEVQEL
jgi:hypothetical protein